jgi:hypothetical protein
LTHGHDRCRKAASAPDPDHSTLPEDPPIDRAGITILLVEQNVHRAVALAHRACVLENGRLVLAGAARDLAADDRLRKGYLGL